MTPLTLYELANDISAMAEEADLASIQCDNEEDSFYLQGQAYAFSKCAILIREFGGKV